jgi:fluoride exporter
MQANPDESREPDEEAGEQIEPSILLKANGPSSIFERLLRHFAILGILIFSSIWGLLAREGLIALNTYSGQSIEPTIWAQAVGCLVMGWNVANKEDLEKWYPPAFIAIGTGFCGSLTTFSSWILHVFQAYGNQNHYDRHGLHNVMDALTQTGATIGMSLISLYAGRALASILPAKPVLVILERIQKSISPKYTRDDVNSNTESPPKPTQAHADSLVPYTTGPDIFCILLGVVFWAGSAVLCGTYEPFRHVTYAVVLSPPGAILRWYLSRFNSYPISKRMPFWPIGTLAANLIATAVLSAAFIGQNVGRVAGIGGGGVYTVEACHALYGVQEGFCGCLSTISTFAVELDNIKPRRRAFGYLLGSYVLGIILCVLIIGAPWWSLGDSGSCKGITL